MQMSTIRSATHEYFEDCLAKGFIVDNINFECGFTITTLIENNINVVFIDAGMDKLLVIDI